MNGVIGDGCPTSARNDSDIFQRDIPAELCQHSHSGCMMNGNILQLNILAAVEDQSRTEPRFMPDYQSVGQNSVRQIRYSDQTVPFQQTAVRNLNTPVIPDQFLFFRVERADDELTGKIVAEIFGKMQPAVFETVFSADFQPAELSRRTTSASDTKESSKSIVIPRMERRVQFSAASGEIRP